MRKCAVDWDSALSNKRSEHILEEAASERSSVSIYQLTFYKLGYFSETKALFPV